MALDDEDFRKIGATSGAVAVAVYVLCTLGSWYFYPGPFSPIENWISDLGNSVLNPHGALIYNSGSIFGGLFLLPFVASLGAWYYGAGKTRYALILAEILGLGSALGLILLGVFTEESGSIHTSIATLFSFAFILLVFIVNVALFRSPKMKKPVALFGLAAVLVGIVSLAALGLSDSYKVLEWLSVYFGLIWVLLFSYVGYRARDVVSARYKKIPGR